MLLEIRTDASFWLGLALVFLTLPLPWVIAALSAAAFHEICHLLVLRSFRIKVRTLKLRFAGAEIMAATMTRKEELLCALAGPAGSFMLVLTVHRFPRLAMCALVQGIWNLLPIGNLDGGRAVKCAFGILSGKRPCKRMKLRVQ